jgi:hypothetical protein
MKTVILAGAPFSNPNVSNIAARAHGAKHRVAAEPNFRAMTELLQGAAERVVAPMEQAPFAKVNQRVSSTRHLSGEIAPAGLLHRLIGIAGRRPD